MSFMALNFIITQYCLKFDFFALKSAKDAIKAIKKRLSAKKDFKSLMYTLTVECSNFRLFAG